MGKKIIYLLSLLMALSLVFASCKKNGITGVQGNFNQETQVTNKTDGLITTWDELHGKYATTPIQDYAVIGEERSDYYRNPVVVALGGSSVLIVTEKRINYPGSANDIGVNGDKPVDIVYLLSTDGGDNFGARTTIGNQSSADVEPYSERAVSAPIVYYNPKVAENTIYIIASAGAGISRVNEAYSTRSPKSQLKYTSGTISRDSDGTTVTGITWSDWQNLTINTSIVTANTQYGTHSARGLFTTDNKLVLPIITADQGINGNPGQNGAHESMGVIFCTVDPNDSYNVAQIGNKIEFQTKKDYFTKYKEARAIAIDTSSTVTYLAIPSPYNGNYTMGMGKSTDPSASDPSALAGLAGSEGSFGFLKLPTNGWYGSDQYDPNQYDQSPGQAGGPAGDQPGEDAILFSHVKSQTGANYLRFLNADYTPKTTQGFQVAKTSKSSSIDVLPDGTIIMATEKELNNSNGLKFNIFFSRYSQEYLAANIK